MPTQEGAPHPHPLHQPDAQRTRKHHQQIPESAAHAAEGGRQGGSRRRHTELSGVYGVASKPSAFRPAIGGTPHVLFTFPQPPSIPSHPPPPFPPFPLLHNHPPQLPPLTSQQLQGANRQRPLLPTRAAATRCPLASPGVMVHCLADKGRHKTTTPGPSSWAAAPCPAAAPAQACPGCRRLQVEVGRRGGSGGWGRTWVGL